TDKHIPYGEDVYSQLVDAGVRCEKDFRNEKLGYKIREGQMQKVPYMLVIGDREAESGAVSPRQRDGKNLGSMNVHDFVSILNERCDRYE
ncbi:MAG: His/Gly/Thr/Pro-type tRNA ligase C-terminal domain-containing protein, partial [Thermodesulfobacteriota bacterium]|nr:His/Gly/Thr/Pro-type tRNA ligase C-terminal domain-containing protein [Thermodesulfobacteriota bacterium]